MAPRGVDAAVVDKACPGPDTRALLIDCGGGSGFCWTQGTGAQGRPRCGGPIAGEAFMSAVMPTYARLDIAFDSGDGPYLFTPDGERYLDFVGGIAVTSVGHGHPQMVAALNEQAAKLWHTSNLYRIPGQERLAQRLADNCFAERVFFCNSGAEAMEGAIKTARRYHFHNGAPERYRVIAFSGAFHGRTLATIAAGDNPKAREGFGPTVDGFDHVAFGNTNEVRAAIGDQTAAILVEPVQGEGGVRPAPDGFLRDLRAIADEFGLMLIYDEVQCGIGRTGKLFAHQWDGVAPDIMALAKGLGGGFPMGAVLATEKAAAGMVPGTHGSTFGGNALAAACGNAMLDILLADGALESVQRNAAILHERTRAVAAAHPSVIESVEGRGMMVGMKCVVPNAALVDAMRARHVLTVAAGGNQMRFLPPLIIGPEHIEEATTALDDACRAVAP